MVFCGCCGGCCCCAKCKKNEKLKDVKLHYVREIVALVVMLLMVSLLFLPTIITPSTEELMKQENNLHELNTIALDNILTRKEFTKEILKNTTLLTALGTPDLDLITKNRQKVLEKLEEELRRNEKLRRNHTTRRPGVTDIPDSTEVEHGSGEDALMRFLSNVLAVRAQDQLEDLEDQGGTGGPTSAEDASREVPGPSDFTSSGRRPPLTAGRVPVRGAAAPGAPSPVSPPPSIATAFFPSNTRVSSNTIDSQFGGGPPPVHAKSPASVARNPQVDPANSAGDIRRTLSITNTVAEVGPPPVHAKDPPSVSRVPQARPGHSAEDIPRAVTVTNAAVNPSQRFNPGLVAPGSVVQASSTGTARFNVRGGTRTGIPLPPAGAPPPSGVHLSAPGSLPSAGRESVPPFRGAFPSAVSPNAVATAASSETPPSGTAVPSFPTPSPFPPEGFFPFSSQSPTPFPSRAIPPTPLPSNSFAPTPFPSRSPVHTPFSSDVPTPTPFPSPSPALTPFPSNASNPTSFSSHSPAPTPSPSIVTGQAPVPSPSPTNIPTSSPLPGPLQVSLPFPVPVPTPSPSPAPVPTPFPSPVPSQAPNPSFVSTPSHLPTPSPAHENTLSPAPLPTSTPSPVPGASPVPAPDATLSSSSSSASSPIPNHLSSPSSPSAEELFSSTTPSSPTPVSTPSSSSPSPEPLPTSSHAILSGSVPGDFSPEGPRRVLRPDPAKVPGLSSAVPGFPEEGLSNTGSDPGIRQTSSSSAGTNVGVQDPAFGGTPVQSGDSLSRGPGRVSSGSAGSRGTSSDVRQPSFAPGRSPSGNAPAGVDPVTTALGGAAGTRLSNVLDTHLANGTLPPLSDSASLLLLLSNVAAARALDRLSDLNDVTPLPGSNQPETGVPEGQGSFSPSIPPPLSPSSIGQTVPVRGAIPPSDQSLGQQQSGAAIGGSVITTNEGSREPVIGQASGVAQTSGIPSPSSGTRSNVPLDIRPSSSAASTTTVPSFSQNLPVSNNARVPENSFGVVGVPSVPPALITTQTSGVPGASSASLPRDSAQTRNTPAISVNNSFPPLGSTLNASTPISSFVLQVANPASSRRGSSATKPGPQVGQGADNTGFSSVGEVSTGTVFPAGVLPRTSPSSFPSAVPTLRTFLSDPTRPPIPIINPFPFPPGPVSPAQLGIKTSSPAPTTTVGGSPARTTTTFTTGPPVNDPTNPANFSQLFRSVAHLGVLKAQQAAAKSVLGTASSTTSTSAPVPSHFQITIPGHSHFHVHASPPTPPTSPPSSTRSPFHTRPQEQSPHTTFPTASTPTQTIHPHFTIPTHSTRSPNSRSTFPTLSPGETSQGGPSEAKQHFGRSVLFSNPSPFTHSPQRSDTSPSSPSPSSSQSSSRTSPSPNINRSVFSFSPPSSRPPHAPPIPSRISGAPSP